MPKELEKVHTRRIIALALCCVVIFALGVVRVFQYQVVNGADYLAQAQRSTETTVSVTAARGEIVDRNGVPLTKNLASFNLEFDFTLMQKKGGSKTTLDNEAANATIANLILAFEELGETWLDELPITLNEPYVFKPDASEAQIRRLRANLELNDYATAQDCIYWLYREYGIQRFKEDGKCSHCGRDWDDCDFESYGEAMSRKIAGVRYQMLLKEFAYTDGHTRFTFAEGISPTSVAWLREQLREYPGATVTEKPIRTYVSGDVAPSVIGSMGAIPAGTYDSYQEKGYLMNEIVGRSGIELALEDTLRGKNGTMGVVQNAKGEVTETYEIEAPVPGNTVQLTLDYYFQKELQRILAEFVESYNASIEGKPDLRKSEAASLVVLDVKTGGVLAVISYPYYSIDEDYSAVISRDGNPMFNRALQGTYQPGSTFKPIVAAGGMLEGIITPDTKIECTGRYRYFSDYQPSCLMDGHRVGSLQDVRTAIWHSCNIFFYDTGRKLTIETMNDYANQFGLAVDTGLEIPNAVGRLNTREDANWYDGNVLQAAIGQLNIGVTPLQMACEAMTFANRGTRYSAHLVGNVLSYDSSEVKERREPQIAAQVALSEEQYSAILDGMVLVAGSQQAPYQLTDLGYPVAMKTGTPQYTSATRLNSAAIGFAPANDPEIAFSILLEDSDNRVYTAKKLVRSILETWEKAKAHPGVDLSTIPEEPAEDETASGEAASSAPATQGTGSSQSPAAASSQPERAATESLPPAEPAAPEAAPSSETEDGSPSSGTEGGIPADETESPPPEDTEAPAP